MLRKLKYIIPAVILLSACDKQLDINTDPNNPTTIAVSKLLPTAEINIGNSLSMGNGVDGGLSQILSVYTHQMTTREDPDQYGAQGTEFYIQTTWDGLYISTLNNLEVIIKDGAAAGNLKYVGIAKILKAYSYSQLVDAFGDVPFSEANKLREGIKYAKFDKGSEIYPQLFTLLDQGIADLNNTTATNLLTPGADDLIYQGSVAKWIKAANTIKLKLLVQQRLIKNVSTEVNALIAGNNLISTTSESFLLPYGKNGATDDRNPGFGDYYASQRGNDVSPWFYEILKGKNQNIYTGITDPRIPYYWFNQLKPTQAAESATPTEYRDGAFVSLYFGSVGPDRDRTLQNNMTLFGIYPVGGRYDDGGGKDAILPGKKITGSDATGAAPYRFITYADRLYLEAELIKTGVITGDAKAKLQQAIDESFKQIDYVVTTYVQPAQTVPAIYNTPAMTTYITNVMAQYDSKPAQQLEFIMTQKWISSVGSSVDQYTDYRRTGFPIMFNPKNPAMAPGGKVQPPINGNPALPGAQLPVEVQANRNYPLTLPWYQGELETNPKAPKQKTDPSTFKPFWLP
jgi:hypothetical protein